MQSRTQNSLKHMAIYRHYNFAYQELC